MKTEALEYANSYIETMSEQIQRDAWDLKKITLKYELATLNKQICELTIEILKYAKDIKYVYDDPEFWIGRGHDEEFLETKWDVQDILKRNGIKHHVEMQVKYHNSDGLVQQPEWVKVLPRMSKKLGSLNKKYDAISKELYG